jgi:Tfp pilus assembly protein PilF
MRYALTLAFALLIQLPVWSAPLPAENPDVWVEVRTPHFIVTSNDGEGTARRIAYQFEQIRFLYSKALQQGLRLDPDSPIVIFAVKNEKALSQIMPEYWAEKGHMHPAGLFVGGEEQNFIALRANGEGEFPYETIYHEYMHLIIRLNFRHFPVWLNEGFAEFFGSATIFGKGGKLGQPSAAWLYALSRYKLIPLDVLFRVDHQSPYYNEADKSGIFYAESWALVHYLMLDPEKQKQKLLSSYLRLVDSGTDPLEAARQAFGDLNQLEKELESYTRRSSYFEYVVSLAGGPDPVDYAARKVPPAEAEARLGDFDLHRGNLDAARARLEQAIRLDPNLAAPQENMGYLLYREDKQVEADKYFARAMQLDSRSARAYYFHAMLAMSRGTQPDSMAEAKAALEKAVSLDPGLAPAWSSLGLLYSQSPETADKALGAVRRATALMPGEPRFQYNLAVVLARARRFEEAQTIAQRLRASGDASISALAAQLLNQLALALPSASSAGGTEKRQPAGLVPASSTVQKAESGPGSLGTPSGHLESLSAAPASPAATSQTYSMMGTISAVRCSDPPQMLLTLTAGSLVMRLHASDLAQLIVKSAGSNAFEKDTPCERFGGQSARISYQLTPGQAWDGEIRLVEFRGEP